MTSKRKLILDVDTGTDDAQAIMLALSHPDAELIAITCVFGNTGLNQVCFNTLRVLKACNRLDVPVYKGAANPLIGKDCEEASTSYHGSDGLGDMPDPDAPPIDLIQKEHAVHALIRLSKQYEGELVLVALAPLTNIALALRLDPDFSRRLKEVVIMGGNVHPSGSGVSQTADYNMYHDPEAAHVVLGELRGTVRLVPYDVCIKNAISWKRLHLCLQSLKKTNHLVYQILMKTAQQKEQTLKQTAFFTCDPMATLVAIDKSFLVEEKEAQVSVELSGLHTRGLSVLTFELDKWDGFLGKCKVVTQVNTDLLLKAYENMFS